MTVDTVCTENIAVIESGFSLNRTAHEQDNRARLKRIYAYVKYGLPYLISFCDGMQFGKKFAVQWFHMQQISLILRLIL